MKITKTPEVNNKELMQRRQANVGCNICPCCGETRKFNMAYGKFVGITSGLSSRTESSGFLGLGKTKTVDLYSCKTCGAEWESEAY